MSMDFRQYVASHSEEIYSKIMGYLPMREPTEHYKIVREYSERRGSYRRPGLLMLTGQMFGAKIENLILPAAAMQLSEDWILMHDDIEDDSELRRGKPALHKIYGTPLAINAGDAAHIAMWKMLKDNTDAVGIEIGDKLFEKFYDMLLYTVEGQYIETNFIYNTRSLADANENLYLRIVASKTCYYTLYGPMQLGSIVAGQRDEVQSILKEIGSPSGVAFQIMDDVLDMTADEKVFGKKRYGDLYEGKLTMIMLHAYQHSTAAEKKKADSIYKKDRSEKTPEDIAFLSGLADKYGSIDYAKAQAEKYGKLAIKALKKYDGFMPDNAYTEIFLSALEEMYKRHK